MKSSSPTQADLLVAETDPGLRQAARMFLKGIDRQRYGFDADMVSAINRLKEGRS